MLIYCGYICKDLPTMSSQLTDYSFRKSCAFMFSCRRSCAFMFSCRQEVL